MACIFCDFPCLSNSLIFKKIKNAKNMAQKAGVRRCFLRFPSDVSLCRDFIANNSIFFKPMAQHWHIFASEIYACYA